MLQAPVFDGLSFDPFSFQQDGLATSEVDIGRREIVQALVVAPGVVVLNKRSDLLFQFARQVRKMKDFGQIGGGLNGHQT